MREEKERIEEELSNCQKELSRALVDKEELEEEYEERISELEQKIKDTRELVRTKNVQLAELKLNKEKELGELREELERDRELLKSFRAKLYMRGETGGGGDAPPEGPLEPKSASAKGVWFDPGGSVEERLRGYSERAAQLDKELATAYSENKQLKVALARTVEKMRSMKGQMRDDSEESGEDEEKSMGSEAEDG